MWTLNDIQITVIDLKEEVSQNIVELQPLASGTVYQYFGYTNPKYPLSCLVVGMDDKNSIEALANTGLAYPLVGAGYSFGNFYVTKVTFQWTSTYKQTFREDKNPEDLVFKGTLELSKV